MVDHQLSINVYRLLMAVKMATVVSAMDFPAPGGCCPHCHQRLEKVYGYEAKSGEEVDKCSVIYCGCGQFAIRTPLKRDSEVK